MQLNTVKTAADLPFRGVELVKTDSQITEVIIGGRLRIRTDGYGASLKVLVEAPGERVKRHRVAATIDGFGAKIEHFEHSWDADAAVRSLEELGAKVERAEVQVVIDALGAVIADEVDSTSPQAPVTVEDVLPF